MTHMSSPQREPCRPKVRRPKKEYAETQGEEKPGSNVVLSLFTVALMMATPSKHVAINMEESRPLLEAQVNTTTVSQSDFFLMWFITSVSNSHQVVSLSLRSAEFDSLVKFDKLYHSGLQFMYNMSAAVNKMASPTSHLVCMVNY